MPTPLTIIIFGASGDLTSRKLVPALYRLFAKGRLPAEARILGVSRSPFSDERFRTKLYQEGFEAHQEKAERWAEFAPRLHYVAGDVTKADGLDALRKWLSAQEPQGDGRRLYYLSVAPQLAPPIIVRLGEEGMSRERDDLWKRLIIEKPFGHDLASARELNRIVHAHFSEQQAFRIDHYLGKETVQNILVLRFANALFEPLWNRTYIDHVQISVSETVTVGQRGDYYDKSGVLRDMFQNHLLQVLALMAMEAPARFHADSFRNEKVKVLEAISVPSAADARGQLVCGQYQGYRREKGVPADSRTPTFAALKLMIENWRWQGVPFYLRSGKALAERSSEVVIQFRCPPHLMFDVACSSDLRNQLSLCLQPDEGIHISFQAKVPDKGMTPSAANLEFHYRDSYPDTPIPEAYERLLQDALQGDASLFMRSDEIERAWEIMDPIIGAIEGPGGAEPAPYPAGSDGPPEADALLAHDGRAWASLCQH